MQEELDAVKDLESAMEAFMLVVYGETFNPNTSDTLAARIQKVTEELRSIT